MILIKIENCFYCIYRDVIEYRDNFLDDNREMIFLISPTPSEKMDLNHLAEFVVRRSFAFDL
jgi:hypothetical protein